jgi:hypothetical protein
MSAFDWLLENEYPLLLLLFVQGMVPYGYGDVRQVPAVSSSFILGGIGLMADGFLIYFRTY